jgi:uncharacterized damage-inducible protein DinB
MAHVLALPGCFARAHQRTEIFERLPRAICDYQRWLEDHGKSTIPSDKTMEFEIAEEQTAIGPFNPGDAAALFAPEKEPIQPSEMERYLVLMKFSRSDLLKLVSGLSLSELDWQAGIHSFSIHRILRHIGNAEEWYVSRLVPTENLPKEWENDENMAIFDFLDLERTTAVTCLQQLSDVQRSQVYFPQHWTDHPDEAWTARKVLRRFLEHEREHAHQIGHALKQYRTKVEGWLNEL